MLAEAKSLGHDVETYQSNSEGALVDRVQSCLDRADALVINAAGYTHTSVALRDAVAALGPDFVSIEVHLSIPGAREALRHTSVLVDVVRGRIEGFGSLSYLLAIRAASALLAARGQLRHQ